jgi:hypothetical protein
MVKASRPTEPAIAGSVAPYPALPARIGTEVPDDVLDTAKTAPGVSTNRHRLVMAHDVLLGEGEAARSRRGGTAGSTRFIDTMRETAKYSLRRT